jgi:hypothetical protein
MCKDNECLDKRQDNNANVYTDSWLAYGKIFFQLQKNMFRRFEKITNITLLKYYLRFEYFCVTNNFNAFFRLLELN